MRALLSKNAVRVSVALLPVAAASAVAAPAGASSGASAQICGHWSALRPAGRGTSISVAVLTRHDAWAAGESGRYSAVLHWNGRAWKNVPSARVGGYTAVLTSISATSYHDVWAVGRLTNRTLILHGNGSRFARVPSPNPAPAGWVSSLSGVAAISASDAWAVGAYNEPGNPGLTFIEHWNGRTWQQVPAPSPLDSQLIAVTAVSVNDVWAVGSYTYPRNPGYGVEPLIVHWDGTSWQQVPSPTFPPYVQYGVLESVSAAAANDVWAVGTFSGPQQTLTEHWNGSSWTRVPSPNPGTSPIHRTGFLSGVAAISSRNAWAVGEYSQIGHINRWLTLIMHWNGSSWRQVKTPNPGRSARANRLNAISASSARNIWAVGESTPNPRGPGEFLAMHYC